MQLITNKLAPVFIALLFVLPLHAGEIVVQDSFEVEPEGWTTYHDGEKASLLSRSDEAARTGTHSLRVETRGLSALEGTRKAVTALEPNRRYTITVWARGEGTVMLCAQPSAGGWVYGMPVALGANWQELRLSIYETGASLSMNVITLGDAQQVVFFIDDLQIVKQPVRTGFDVAVSPVKFEAQDYLVRKVGLTVAQARQDAAASGGAYTFGWPNMALGSAMLFPRTTLPVYIYLKALIEENNENNSLEIANSQPFQKEERRYLATLPAANEWVWVKAGPFVRDEIVEGFSITHRGPDRVRARLDCVVVSTADNLTEAQLDAAPNCVSHRPLVAAGKSAAAPVLDGAVDDRAWDQSVALGGFGRFRTAAPAEASTVARVTYDDENLYISFVCDEPILSVVGQRTHEFRANITGIPEDGDGPNVWWDDHVFVMLSPPGDERYFDFFVNANGIIADGICRKPDMWTSRDGSWNSHARAAGRIEDGYWMVEMAIPFAGLDRQAPQPGEAWEIGLGRRATSRNEYSSWNLFAAGLHDPVQMGHLVFAHHVPGLQFFTPDQYEAGVNTITTEVTPADPAPAGIYLMSSLRAANRIEQKHEFVELSGDAATIEQAVTITEAGEMSLALGAVDAFSFSPLYFSSQRTASVGAQTANLKVAADSLYRVFINGRPVAQGTGNGQVDDVNLFLQKGQNVIAVEVDNGTAALRIEAPGLADERVRWRVGEPGDRAVAVAADDRTWAIAPEAGRHEELGTVFGTPGAPAVLRHTLLWDESRIWPTQEPAVHIAAGTNQSIRVGRLGLPDKPLENWTLYFGMPEAFDFRGVTGYYNLHGDYSVLSEEIQEIDGRRLRVVAIRAGDRVVHGIHSLFSNVHLVIGHRNEPGNTLADDAAFVFWTEANDGTLTEARVTTPVKLLPPIDGRQPERFIVWMWQGFPAMRDNKAVNRPILETLRDAGVNETIAGTSGRTAEQSEMSSYTLEYGIKSVVMLGGSLEVETRDYIADNPAEALIKMDGTPHAGRMCTTLMLGDYWFVIEEYLKEMLVRTGAHHLDYDYEYSALRDGGHACYCPRCIAEFRKYADIPDETALDGEIINRAYDTQWVDFMARRVAMIFRKLKDTLEEIAPEVKLSIYSGYHRPENARQYGVNWEYVGELQATHYASMGYGRSYEMVTATKDVLAGIPFIPGEIIRPYDHLSDRWPLIPLNQAVLLQRALDSTGGVLIYTLEQMDGRGWHALAETTRLIAAFEDLFMLDSRETLPDQNEANVRIVTGGDVTLVAAMNPTASVLRLNLPLPADLGEGYEFYSQEKTAPGQVMELALDPGEVRVYVFGQ